MEVRRDEEKNVLGFLWVLLSISTRVDVDDLYSSVSPPILSSEKNRLRTPSMEI